jgi:hypothetical protein
MAERVKYTRTIVQEVTVEFEDSDFVAHFQANIALVFMTSGRNVVPGAKVIGKVESAASSWEQVTP